MSTRWYMRDDESDISYLPPIPGEDDCRTCNNRGVIMIKTQSVTWGEPCPKCNIPPYEGTDPDICVHCRGYGTRAWRKTPDRDDLWEWTEDDDWGAGWHCHWCNGTGTISGAIAKMMGV